MPPIFVISLARCTEREKAMRERLDSLGLDYQIFNGVDGKSLQPQEYAHRTNKEHWRCLRGRDLTMGEIGCFMSHYSLWQMLIEKNLEVAVVLEDDCILQPCFAEVIQGVLAVDYEWDVVLLSARKQYAIDRVLCKIGGGEQRLVRFRKRVGTARAYLITRPAAKKLIHYCYKIRAPIDWLYAEWWYNGLRFYAVTPALTISDKVPSIIGSPPRLSRTWRELCWAKKKAFLSFIHRHQFRLTVSPQKKEISDEKIGH